MTTPWTPSPTDGGRLPDEWLDRLVDGELSPSEYRQALHTLERQSDGWKRCALAFLESQAWRASMVELTHAPPAPVTIVDQGGQRPPSYRASGPSMAWWVALAASVVLAFWSGRWIGLPVAAGRPGLPLAVESQPSDAADLIGPRVNADQQFVNNFWSGSPALTPEIRNELRRIGAQVRQDHGYIPLRTVDGRRVLVPYEDVQIVPVNRRAF